MEVEKEKEKMKKKLMALILCMVIALGLTACQMPSDGKRDADNSDVTQSQTQSYEAKDITVAALKGPTAIGMVKLMEDSKEKKTANNYDFKIAASADEFSSLLIKGDVQIAALPCNAAATLYNKSNGKIKVLGINTLGVLYIVEKGNTVQNVADLKGKTIAIPSVQSSQNILINELLERNGMSKNDVNIIQMSPTEMPFSLASGAISGYCVAEPYGAVSISKNFGKVLATSDELWNNSLCCALVLNGNIRSDEKVTNELIEKYYRAAEQLESEGSEETAGKFLGQETSVIEESGKWINFKNLTVSKEEYDDLCNKLKKYGINENPPSYEDFIYNP